MAILKHLEQGKLRHKDSLSEMQQLLQLLGHKVEDLDSLRIIHVAGSKGKGSTSAFAESILRLHGLKTALFTSPHLIHPRERLKLDGYSLSLMDFSNAVIEIYERLLTAKVASMPGFFRFMTLLAFDQMLKLGRKNRLDVAIVEVGMGGRYDSTNIIQQPFVTAITSLSMEHVRSLGPTLSNIAHHKVGIAKFGAPLLSAPQPIEAVKVLQENAEKTGVSLSFVDPITEFNQAGFNDAILCKQSTLIYIIIICGSA